VNGYLLALLGVAGGLFAAAIGDMVSEEIRDRLDHLPHAILRLAACRLDAPLSTTASGCLSWSTSFKETRPGRLAASTTASASRSAS